MSTEDNEQLYLAHYGIKGMKWGVRKSTPGLEGISPKTSRTAKKDATEFAKAKMFYGEGAGTRRKLIKAKVEARSAKDPSYKKAFDVHLDNQDMSKRANQARGTRRRRDVKNSAAKNTRGAINIARGNSQYAPALLVAAVGVGSFAKSQGFDKTMARTAKATFRTVQASMNGSQGKNASQFLKDLGIN